MNIGIPELDELIDDVERKIDLVKEYGPPEITEMTLDTTKHALRRISEYVARCNIFGYVDMVFYTGTAFSDIGTNAELIRIGLETGLLDEMHRPCKKCSTKEISENYADLLTEIAVSIKTVVTISSEFLKDNCCPIEEEEILKHI
jgi:hypothetical protein